MVKLNEIGDVRKAELVKELVKEQINKNWLKEIILGKRFRASHLSRELTEVIFFERYIWDNLTEEQRKQTLEVINILIEKDILVEKQPDGNYCFDLLDLAVRLGKKSPGSINSRPFLIWK